MLNKRAGVLAQDIYRSIYFLDFLAGAPLPPFAVLGPLAFAFPFACLEAAALAAPGFSFRTGRSATGVWRAETDAL